MRNLLIMLPLLLASAIVRAEAPAAGDVLTDDESLTMCAEALPKHLECRKEFCKAMVKIRTKGNKNADLAAMEAKCLEEIAVDGTGDLPTRKARCAAWTKQRPKMSVPRSEANEMQVCWTKPTCEARIDCWAPKMSKLMESAAPKKK